MTTPLNAQTLLQFSRIGAVSLSPDGSQAVCTLSSVALEHNRLQSTLWRLSLGGDTPRALTTCGTKDGTPAFSPDGSAVAFTAEREQEG